MKLIKGKSLLERYNKHIDKLKKNGIRLTEYHCPTCDKAIETLLPAKSQMYDSMVECPYCGKMHFKVVFDNGQVRVTC